ncbi:hypothetical protein [Undibacterium sp. TC9W]|uniref:hypothetical protein n=1 Tax=Undibacterium sp. TC9W TaxID=3413053 RepID=UPI003BF28E5D
MSVNESEERLADLSRRTFMSMWSYQNPFYKEGKELCDVLIVFGQDVIVISDKAISYTEHKDSAIPWSRWYRKAVEESVIQLRAALKTIKNRPGSIHLDAKVSSPFPLEFPDPTKARYHLVAVAHGSEQAGAAQYGTPSLAVDSDVVDDKTPLTVGVHFDDVFVHVVNRTALDAMFECFDTTADLIGYLNEKQTLFSGRRVFMYGEEDLIALYMRGRRPDGSASLSELVEDLEHGTNCLEPGLWTDLQASASFADRRNQLAPSYVIDDVVEQLASEHRLGRISGDRASELAYHATAFQLLSAESRMARMLIGLGVVDVLNESPSTFWSVVIESRGQPGVLYLWLIYPVVDGSVSDDDLEQRVGVELADYIVVAMSKFPNAHTFFGIAMPNAKDSRTSRVFRLCKRDPWTREMQAEAEMLGRAKEIMSNIESTTYVAVKPI